MNRLVVHIALPGISTLAIAGLYFTPVDVFGCAGRGLIALAIVLLFVMVSQDIDRSCFAREAARRQRRKGTGNQQPQNKQKPTADLTPFFYSVDVVVP